MGYAMPSRCWCCVQPGEETLQHLFFTSFAVKKVWSYFLMHAGIKIEGLSMHQVIVKCWTLTVISRLQPIFQALPAIIMWELWKRRNSYKHGETMTIRRVIYQYTPKLKVTKVLWELPTQGWIKVNCDGASRGNPSRSSIGYALRDDEGNIKYACGKVIHDTTNNEAEALAILEALKYCEEKGYNRIILQTDSLLLKNTIEGLWNVPWVSTTIQSLVRLRKPALANIPHNWPDILQMME
uniref:RNase H type-1 domain-containing protein n=1 Tax=Nicotiana tabacum TaxID=4097 RepID=A0A1S4AMC6_TOBAC